MKKALFSIGYMFFITFLFTLLVSAVKLISEEKIQQNENAKLQKIVLQVMGIADAKDSDEEISRFFNKRIREAIFENRKFYTLYEDDGQAIEIYAFSLSGSGFWGPIEAMLAVDRDMTKIIGISFYKHTETPGLGARITEDWFVEQFAGLSLHPVSKNDKLFYLRPAGTQKSEKDLDAITGATGTSRAVENFLNIELEKILRDFGQIKLKG